MTVTVARLPNGRCIVPGQAFTARVGGRLRRFTYRGSMGEGRSGPWVNAIDRRGLSRAVLVERITAVHRMPT